MAKLPDFQRRQYAFAAHIRDPKSVAAPPGIEDRRMAVYRELFFNNLRNLLSNMFPVLRKLHEPAKWNQLVRQFMRQHRARTPYFLELPTEFRDFLENEYAAAEDDYPFLVELAHYEYVELALSISEAQNDLTGIDPAGDLLADTPVKSVLCWEYCYRFPVHRISQDFLPEEPLDSPVCLAVYRRADDKVRFMELNPVSARLLERLGTNPGGSNGEEILRMLAAETGYPDADAMVRHGLTTLEELRGLEIIIGTRPSPDGARQ